MLAFLEGPDLVIVALIVLLVFGGTRLPQLARSLGEAQREFRKGLQPDDEKQPAADQANEPARAVEPDGPAPPDQPLT